MIERTPSSHARRDEDPSDVVATRVDKPDLLGSDGLAVILDCVADGVFTVDLEWRITFFNAAAEAITGFPRAQAVGRQCSEVLRADICNGTCALRQTMSTSRPVVGRLVEIQSRGGTRVPISVSTALLRNRSGRVIGGVETIRDLSEVEDLRRKLSRRQRFGNIVTRSHAMEQVLELLPQIARSDATCLVGGESGTGKELVARAIHKMSGRSRGPFLAVNCGALPDTLLESELFGHEAGAFTDAKRARPGRFAHARGGTLFLDEIGDVSPALQVRLLRVLQEKEYQPLGSDDVVKTDVRVIAATNRDLAVLADEGRFRADLYYRLNVVSLELPPLRARTEDIPLLVDHFVERFSKALRKDVRGISAEVLSLFMTYPWPGNVRELENAIEHACILCTGGLIQMDNMPAQLRARGGSPVVTGGTLADHEARVILEALRRNHGNRRTTALELGIGKTTLWRKLRALGLDHGREP